MSLDSSTSNLEANGLPFTVQGLCYDVDGSACGFDRLTFGPVYFDSMQELKETLTGAQLRGIMVSLDVEAQRLAQAETRHLRELRRWLDKRRNG